MKHLEFANAPGPARPAPATRSRRTYPRGRPLSPPTSRMTPPTTGAGGAVHNVPITSPPAPGDTGVPTHGDRFTHGTSPVPPATRRPLRSSGRRAPSPPSANRSTHPEEVMRLRDTDPLTLALVKMGLTLDQRDGVLLTDEDPEEVFAFFAEIAPEHHLYVQVDNRWDVNIAVGVFRRPREHMRRM